MNQILKLYGGKKECSLREHPVFSALVSFLGGREATTGNRSTVRRLEKVEIV